jgi:hypothetical protein
LPANAAAGDPGGRDRFGGCQRHGRGLGFARARATLSTTFTTALRYHQFARIARKVATPAIRRPLLGPTMSARQDARPYDISARKWRDLAERRRQHLVDLCESGRWQRYYTEQQFLLELDSAIRSAEEWARIAPAEPAPDARGDVGATVSRAPH